MQYIGIGEFGNIYISEDGNTKNAIVFLLNKESGEVRGALFHPNIGDISLVYGNDNAGLKKIKDKHPEVIDNLQEIIELMQIQKESENRIKLYSERFFAVVSKDFCGVKRDAWLLTAFEKKNSVSNNRMDTVETP